MPRTKISKNTKRNRQATNEELVERLKDIDTKVEQFMLDFDLKLKEVLKLFTTEFVKIRNRLPETILSMKFGDFISLDVNTIDDYKATCNTTNNSKLTTINSTSGFNRKVSKEDEGYLTEDGITGTIIKPSSSSSASTSSTTTLSSQSSGIIRDSRPLGPLSSAKARARHRRSRSACTYFAGDNHNLNSQNTKSSKSKNHHDNNDGHGSQIRTMSADRARPITPKITPNTPLSIIRYPRLGETVISLSGSPVVAQGITDATANVNIPLKNGIISLRPTKMDGVDRNIITQIDKETLHQIKQLQSNLNIIMNFASKESGL